jgi:hypothetical protein
MHMTYRRVVAAVALLAGTGFALRPLWAVPNGAHFSAPHQNGVRSFVSRIELNSRAPDLVKRVLHAVAPTTVYACDGPPCDGTKSAPVTGVYCASNQQCAQWGCNEVGGQSLCQTYTGSCILPSGTIPCQNSQNLSCQ